MNILADLRARFARALAPLTDDVEGLSRLVLPAQNPQFGDYQANCAMPLANQTKRPPREVAAEIVSRLEVEDICDPPEIAGPGFINLRLQNRWLADTLTGALTDERLGVGTTERPRKVVIDYSSPNVAKPMHVGHLRSSVIGASLYELLKFLGDDVVSDNHIGDWGTQFGMILYGYKHLRDEQAYRQNIVAELSRLYRLVNQLCEYRQVQAELPNLVKRLEEADQGLHDDQKEWEQQEKTGLSEKLKKEFQRKLKKREAEAASLKAAYNSNIKKMAVIEDDPELSRLAQEHPQIVTESRLEIAKLHAGDEENRRLWEEFLPACNQAMEEVYQRLGIRFDMTLGESYYQPMLADVVRDLEQQGLARESQGATCVFIEGNRAPFIVRKQDGAYTYATTDLATIRYRVQELNAEVLLYVVDKRQSEHFQLLFETARLWGYEQLDCRHISFGTVMGQDGKPYKTRSGDIVGLASLLDEAVSRARVIVNANDAAKPNGPELDEAERQRIAEIVGLGSIKYADLHHNRDSDYVFDWDKMISMTGDTAAYMQYAYARVCGIFRKAGIPREELRSVSTTAGAIRLEHPAERALGLQLARFEDALLSAAAEYRPNILTAYLFETANAFSVFYDQCPVASEEDPDCRQSRFRLCDLTARTIALGLRLLGIETSERM